MYPLGYKFTCNVCTLHLPPTELLVQNQSPSGCQRGLQIHLATHGLLILSPANVALQLMEKFFKALMLVSLWAERHITSAHMDMHRLNLVQVLFERWANPCNVWSRACSQPASPQLCCRKLSSGTASSHGWPGRGFLFCLCYSCSWACHLIILWQRG